MLIIKEIIHTEIIVYKKMFHTEDRICGRIEYGKGCPIPTFIPEIGATFRLSLEDLNQIVNELKRLNG